MGCTYSMDRKQVKPQTGRIFAVDAVEYDNRNPAPQNIYNTGKYANNLRGAISIKTSPSTQNDIRNDFGI